MYELTGWNGKTLDVNGNKQKILIERLLLDDTILSSLNGEIKDDVIDIEFVKSVKKADSIDYCFAVFSGALSFLVDRAIRTSEKVEEFNLDGIDLNQLFSLVLKLNNCSKKFDHAVEDVLSRIDVNAKNINDYVELAEDFKSEFDYRGLLLTIIYYVLNIEVGKDENDHIVFNKVEDKYSDNGIAEKICIGFMMWLLNQAEYYKKHGKFKQRYKQAVEFGQMLKKLEPIIKELAETLKKFDVKELSDWFVGLICKSKGVDKLDAFTAQSIAVNLNILLVHTYAHVRNFLQQVKEHNIQSLEGLKIIDFNRIDNTEVIQRLSSVSTGIFTAFDFAYAGLKAAPLVAAGQEGAALKVFATSINIPNVMRFVVVMKDDGKQIIQDVNNALHKAKIEEVHTYKEIDPEELTHCFGLSSAETRILYSLELQMVNEDIQKTKESSNQILKEKWKQKWMNISTETYPQVKLFEEDTEKVYKLLITNAENKPDRLWLYNLAFELSLFRLYCPLGDDPKENKEFKKLKLEDKKYLEGYFCKKQNYIDMNDINGIKKCYQNQYNYLDNSTLKVGAAAAGVVALGGITGGLAFAFAPEIAVAIFGGAFPALHGAALANAALAAAGGGALAAGGLGMGGGALIIAGGGALLTAGTSGVASSLLLAPKFVQNDYAKLLAQCEYVLLGKMNMIDEVVAIQKQRAQSKEQQRIRIKVLENIQNPDEETKKKLKALKKSYEYTDRTIKALLKMIESYEKQHG